MAWKNCPSKPWILLAQFPKKALKIELTQVAVPVVGGAVVARAIVGVSSVEVTIVGRARVGNAVVCNSSIVRSLHQVYSCVSCMMTGLLLEFCRTECPWRLAAAQCYVNQTYLACWKRVIHAGIAANVLFLKPSILATACFACKALSKSMPQLPLFEA